MLRGLSYAVWLAVLFHGAAFSQETPRKIRVVATLFPQYDFARAIGGDLAAVSMLPPPGADSHSYEPNPSDMARLVEADLVLHTGDAMEPWIARIRDAIGEGGQNGADKFFDVSAGIPLMAAGDHHGREDEDGHSHTLDPHFWLDPLLAECMAENVAAALAQSIGDGDSSSAIDRNARRLTDGLRGLHRECEAMAGQARRKTLVFGGRFAFAYFFRRYGLERVGVYDGCGPGVEPSVRRIVEIVQYVKDHGIPVVYHEELVEPRIARAIAGETGAATLMVHSLHNLSRDDFAAGLTFLGLMRENIRALLRGTE